MILTELINIGTSIKEVLIGKVASIMPFVSIENVSITYCVAGMVVLIFGLSIAEIKIKELSEKYPQHKKKLSWGITGVGMSIIYFIAF